MLKFIAVLASYRVPVLSLLALACAPVRAQNEPANVAKPPVVAAASEEGELAIKKFQVAPGLKVDLWASEPMLANPVAFNFDEKGRAYVCETFRLNAGVDDIRGIMDWLDEELACRTTDDRLAEMKRHLGDRFARYSEHSERVSRIEDRDGDGKADHATVFADGFSTPLDGIGAGVLARHGSVWYANIPNFWLLRDTNDDGFADFRQSLHYGLGVRVGFIGHDAHGVHFGPDGKIYFSVGDRGSSVKVADGRTVGEPDTGCVFRCNPDGSELEVFAFGLRNPQDLVFDQYGNLFTGDNNSDSGDQARWVYVVEGGDSGWRVGYQFMERPYSRGPFNAEKLWHPHFEGQAAYLVPPITNIAAGPSGVAYFPGTGLPERFQDHFFLVDFRGGGANSGVHTFTLKPKGASFELVEPRHVIWGVLATDVKFGVDGGLYVSDWVQGWEMTGKGRIYRVHDPAIDRSPLVLETKKLLAEGMEKRSSKELSRLLAHRDMRVRQEAQFALADRGWQSAKTLIAVARDRANQIARLHSIWAIGQISSKFQVAGSNSEISAALDLLVQLLADDDPEVRVQAAKVLGERNYLKAYDGLVKLLGDASPRVRFFATMSLGKLRRREALPAIFAMLRDNADRDPCLRHAGVMALTWIGEMDALVRAANDTSSAVRMGVLLAMRRLHRAEIATFLRDENPGIVLEAARAINDEPINGAMADLAALIAANTPHLPDQADGNEKQGRGASRPDPGSEEALLRRVLNANFHFGTADSAKALASFSARADAAETMRVEALDELADWPHPSGRDRVIGLWRPVAAVRRRETAIEALRPVLSDLLRSAPDSVPVAAARAVGRLNIAEAGPVLSELVADTKLSDPARVEALKALAAIDDPRLEEAVKVAQADANEDLRRAATMLQVKVKSSNAATKLALTLEHGSLGEKQAALAALAGLPDPGADDVLSGWLTRLLAGDVPMEIRLDLIESAEKRSAAAVKAKLEKFLESKPKDDPLAGFRETLYGGTAAEGRKIFLERPEASCVRCHKVNGEGGEVGPDLSHLAAQKDRQFFLESILLPNKEIARGFESVLVTLKNGSAYAGVVKSENNNELLINSPEDGLVTVKKSDIQSREKGLSPMPEGMGQVLSKQDLRNLVEFLSSLK